MTPQEQLLSSTSPGIYNIVDMALVLAGGEVIDITNKFKSLSLYEDIHSPFVTGNMELEDTTDTAELFSDNAPDLLRFRFCSNGLDPDVEQNLVGGVFWIYKRSDRVQTSDRSISLKLHFASVELLVDSFTAIPNAFINKTIPEAVTALIDNYLYDPEVTSNMDKKQLLMNTANPISRKVSFVSNQWRTTQALSFIAAHAMDDAGDATYLFFENKLGLNFLNLTDMAALSGDRALLPKISDSNYSPKAVNNISGGMSAEPNPDRESRVMTGIRKLGEQDILKMWRSGAVAVRTAATDLLKKTVDIGTADYYSTRLSRPVLNDNHPGMPDLKGIHPQVRVLPQHYDLWDNSTDTSSNENIYPARAAQLSQLENSSVEVDLMGRTDWICGRLVNVEFTRKIRIGKGADPSDYVDRKYTGDYLISAIAHRFEHNMHTMTMEICRDGILAPLEK